MPILFILNIVVHEGSYFVVTARETDPELQAPRPHIKTVSTALVRHLQSQQCRDFTPVLVFVTKTNPWSQLSICAAFTKQIERTREFAAFIVCVEIR